MPNSAVTQPWDEAPMRRDLVDTLHRLPRERLDRLADLPSVPGCYVQWTATRVVEPTLGHLVATGQYPSYLGVATVSLRERVGRYRQNIRGTSLRERDIYVAVLPCTSAASALFAERAALEEIPVPLAGLGFGSKAPGANRSEQSPVDALFPGRRWASPADLVAQAKARLKVLSWLVNLAPDGPRWPALVSDDEDVDADCGDLSMASVTSIATWGRTR
jgi:hypothetical protein